MPRDDLDKAREEGEIQYLRAALDRAQQVKAFKESQP